MQNEKPKNVRKTKGGYDDSPDGAFEAVWDFLLEHSELLPSGSLFIKFHTSGKKKTINRFKGRFYYGYHREDVAKKHDLSERLQEEHRSQKREKKDKYKRSKKYARVGAYLKKHHPFIHRLIYKYARSRRS